MHSLLPFLTLAAHAAGIALAAYLMRPAAGGVTALTGWTGLTAESLTSDL